MTETTKRGRPALRPETAEDRRRRWRVEVEASGLRSEQVAAVIKRSIPTVWSYGSASGAVPPEAAIRALARRNLAHAESEVIRLAFFDQETEGA